MTVTGWDEPYPHDVVRLSISKHYAKRRTHLCAECFKNIELGDRYICTVYLDGRKVTEYKVHEACPYSLTVLTWIKDWWRGHA